MSFGISICSKIMEFDLKWVHVARYELILKLDGALWLRIILKPLLTPKRAIMTQRETPNSDFAAPVACLTASWPEEPSGPKNVDFLM